MSPPQTDEDRTINAELLPDAGKVSIDAGKPWGKGLIEDIRTTVGTHWVSEMVSRIHKQSSCRRASNPESFLTNSMFPLFSPDQL